MKHVKILLFIVLATVLMFGFGAPISALADTPSSSLTISTQFPSMVVGIGETVTLNMTVTSPTTQVVNLDVANVPADWTAEFWGSGRVVHSVYVDANKPATVELRVTPATTTKAGTFDFTVTAKDDTQTADFPVEFDVKDKVPASLAFSTDYPTISGGPDSPFTFNVALKNNGDSDVTVTVQANAPKGLAVKFQDLGKDITNIPTDVKANSTQNITVTATPLSALDVGDYPIDVTAQGDTVNADIKLDATVVGQPNLSLATSDGTLSGTAYINQTNTVKLVLHNAGNSPAQGVKLTASAPSGWTVTLNPSDVAEVPANSDVNVTADVKPASNAISGDYIVTFNAQPNDSPSKSVDFRVTVQTSTLWGIAGIVLIAIAVAIVGMAVTRFGRR